MDYYCEAIDENGRKIGGFVVTGDTLSDALSKASKNIEVAIRPTQPELRIRTMEQVERSRHHLTLDKLRLRIERRAKELDTCSHTACSMVESFAEEAEAQHLRQLLCGTHEFGDFLTGGVFQLNASGPAICRLCKFKTSGGASREIG